MKKENNIFDFATKELSQDALLCWLINFKNYKDDKILYRKSIEILNYIFKCKNLQVNIEEYSIEIMQQYNFIDIFILLKDKEDIEKYAIIIEDKKLTSIHNNQIEIYKAKIKNIYKSLNEENIITVYYKPYEELEIIKADVIINREYMLNNIFNNNIDNQIFMDYKKYLQEIDDIYKYFESTPIKKWNKIMLYKCAKEYNKKQKETNKKMRIAQVRGSAFIDWYEIININKKFSKYFTKIYLSLNINYGKFELRVRGITKQCSADKRNELENLIREKCRETEISVEKFSHRKIKEKTNIILTKINLNENYCYKDLILIIKKLEKIINEII